MWLVLGLSAILLAILNIESLVRGKNNNWYGFGSLSLTSLTACSLYFEAAKRVINNDSPYLLDVLPTMSYALWFCVITSIILNAIPLIVKNR